MIRLAHKPAQVATDGVITRFEDKYFIDKKHEDNFIQQLTKHMKLSFPNPNTKFTYIKSCYLDSSSLDFFLDHFRKLEERQKIRLRQYAPNGHWEETALLEIKRKKNLESKKTRFYISHEDINKKHNNLLYFDSQEICLLNKTTKLSTLQKRVNSANELIQDYRLVPRMNVTYHRLAFEHADIRMTLDHDITYEIIAPLSPLLIQMVHSQTELWQKALSLWENFSHNNHTVLEIKHQGKLPTWAEDLIYQQDLKQTSFSKYCWAMTGALSQVG